MTAFAAQCFVDGCDRPDFARGWCETHYQRWVTNGDVGPAAIGTEEGASRVEGEDMTTHRFHGSRDEWLDFLVGRSPKSATAARTQADTRRARCWCGCEGGTPGQRPYSSPISSGTDAHRAEGLERALRGQPIDPWHDAEVGTVVPNASVRRGGRRA
jgi:hypothetical protein